MEASLQGDCGIEFCRTASELTSASIMIVTGKQDCKDEVASFKAGCADYIRKPFDRRVVVARVEGEMQRRRRLLERTVEMTSSAYVNRNKTKNLFNGGS